MKLIIHPITWLTCICVLKGFEDCSILNQLLNEYDHDLKIIVKIFSSKRVVDAEAISDLAFYNYIEVLCFCVHTWLKLIWYILKCKL